ncbi:dihydropteroate synthase [Fodinisporobacter ferrooxydans]|uniref:Dihydropteroate synthase n=1 Tax=Fodinisporobacter ferrooxydans TaxID=2901836 RepID=A0ABY4CMX5_9BACL|nr:dihydropteroate synthase [Alicyclobacillaceae bacterium MYW30-H2]
MDHWQTNNSPGVHWMAIKDWKIRDTVLPTTQKTLVMGILNMTPDSFSDGGSYSTVDIALQRVREMIEDGADIIDIGGESTRPGYQPVSEEEELRRVIPVIERIRKEFTIPLSIDTYKSNVARAAILAGADIINDIGGLQYDGNMAKTAAELKVPVIVMHNRSEPTDEDFVATWIQDMQKALVIAIRAGIEPDRIILDPGIGFAKTHEQNLLAMKYLHTFCNLGYPVLLGTSRKSIIAKTLNLPVQERVEGTAATVACGIFQGAAIVRVHDTKAMVRVAKMTDAMMRVRG